MLQRTRSSTRLTTSNDDKQLLRSPTRSGTKRRSTEDLENLPSPPSTPTRRQKTSNVTKAETPQNVRNITKELQMAQLQSPNGRNVYLKSKGLSSTDNNSNNKSNKSKQEETLYQKAKAVFRRTAIPSRLIGRGDEREQMLSFWKEHVLANKPGCLYISGMPGTGKTAMLTEVIRRMEDDIMALRSHRVSTVVVNCMSVKEPKQIYQKLIEELSPAASIQQDVVKQAEELINANKSKLNVVILDEIDSLITRDQDVLYKIFEWASLPTSRLVLIGIANALDLTDRILPRLRAKNCEPQLMNFNPYQVSEITSIIRDRLFSLIEDPDDPFAPPPKAVDGTPAPLIQANAIELCARKVAASMGDLRTALDVCRQAIELAEMEQKKKSAAAATTTTTAAAAAAATTTTTTTTVLGEQRNGATLSAIQEPKVTVVHVMKVLNVVFGSSTTQKLKQLNLQQKIVLGVILVMLRTCKKGNKKDQLVMGKFREQYSALCSDTASAISAVSRTELNDLMTLLETSSIITLGKSKEDRTRKIQLNVQENEIAQMINDMPILKSWMDESLQKLGH
ncbi:E3 ubiquitin-protein ligase bre1 [Mucor velutinosus]|uniref:Cell division control protein n=1 Tax=Mucor velutinosus TaxID=708070 RepID=A0AAN7DLG4_9FUNG|nr:E3 ubiquitin-protein ligase bre1 [Mucor velutinosus]